MNMQRTLGFIRHGKATRDFAHIEDLDRPLKEVGIIKSIDVAEKLRKQNIIPDLIVSSPAIRALHTAIITGRVLGYPYSKIIIEPLIYSDSEDEILEFIQATDDSVNNLFIFGHNPVLTTLANYFLKHPTDLPTSGAVMLQLNLPHWCEISKKHVQEEILFIS
jgi:phosphohistidine phosphatase